MPGPRVTGLRGRLPVKPPAERFPLGYLDAYLSEPLPVPVYPIDVTGGIGADAWGMLGNGPDPTCTTYPNGVGDCSFAAELHYRMSKAASYGETEQFPDSDAVVAAYLAYDDGQDVGANLADLLLSWYHSGVIAGFAPVDYTDPLAVDAALQAFKGIYVGVDLTDDADELFGQGSPWTVSAGQQPDPNDGHCVVGVKATATDRTYVTWGAEQAADAGWSAACLQEAWVILTSTEDAVAAGVDLAALTADIDALGGTPPAPPAPVTPPVPPPVSPETLLQELAAKVRAIASTTGQDINNVISWLHAHGI